MVSHSFLQNSNHVLLHFTYLGQASLTIFRVYIHFTTIIHFYDFVEFKLHKININVTPYHQIMRCMMAITILN